MDTNVLEVIIWVLPPLSLPMSLLFAVLLAFARSTIQKVICTFVVVAGLLIGVSWAWVINWVFRDGLGPDSIESHGQLAQSRFWEAMRHELAFAAFIIVVTGVAMWYSSQREK